MNFKPPIFNKKFFCIVNSSSVNIAALISSYIYVEGFYTPLFECKMASISNPERQIEGWNEDFISVTILQELDIKISNALNMVGSCEYLILGGLDDKQKTYFSFLEKYNVIEIKTETEVHLFLGSLTEKKGPLKTNEKSILHSLYLASKNNYYLEIDNTVDDYIIPCDYSNGLIVIEDIEKTSTIIGINYSLSIFASIAIIPPPRIDVQKAKSLIKDWACGNENAINDLKAEIYDSIENIDFTKYEFATFFTTGIPYSLILDNVIPVSHVHLYLNPDIFVFNSIYFESNFLIESSIVFSPLEFVNEETEYVKNKLTQNNYYVKELFGPSATAHNLDFYIKIFPFNILHICSHGGEINGYELNEEFTDRDGQIHRVRYHEVVSFAPSPSSKLIKVAKKRIIREFDGFDWKTSSNEKDKYPDYVFSDMFKSISQIEKANRIPINGIPDSCSIKCSDFNYQGMFNILAGLFSPIIFNNTCWSWSEIGQTFISSGSRGYIGTLWDINNDNATEFAESFYTSLFDDTILNSLHKSLDIIKGTRDEDVYIYWGLHFSTLPKGNSINESRFRTAIQLLNSLERWKKKLPNEEGSLKNDIQEIIAWIASKLYSDFNKETLELIVRKDE